MELQTGIFSLIQTTLNTKNFVIVDYWLKLTWNILLKLPKLNGEIFLESSVTQWCDHSPNVPKLFKGRSRSYSVLRVNSRPICMELLRISNSSSLNHTAFCTEIKSTIYQYHKRPTLTVFGIHKYHFLLSLYISQVGLQIQNFIYW